MSNFLENSAARALHVCQITEYFTLRWIKLDGLQIHRKIESTLKYEFSPKKKKRKKRKDVRSLDQQANLQLRSTRVGAGTRLTFTSRDTRRSFNQAFRRARFIKFLGKRSFARRGNGSLLLPPPIPPPWIN